MSKRANQDYAKKAISRALEYRNNIFGYVGWTSSIRFAPGAGLSNWIFNAKRRIIDLKE